ncbi:MAG: radical SAM protein [Candidatus Methanospirareceae archaeon]
MKRRVCAIHVTDECNKNCSFCYRSKTRKQLPKSFFLEMVKYLPEVTEQVALGGGELYYASPEFVEEFSKMCNDYGLICNITTNGSLPDRIIRHSKYITMVSVSYDREKWRSIRDFLGTLRKLRESDIRVGVNFLIDDKTFKPPVKFIKLVDLFFHEAERVFVLYPKKVNYFIPILNYKEYYGFLSLKYKHFYVDDSTYQILKEKKYKDWSNPCHYGKDIISIDPEGYVTGCSFDPKDKAVLKLEKPKDILKIKETEFEERFSCPYVFWR